jgi:hypothetical protein
MPASLKTGRDRMAALQKAVTDLTKTEVLIGIPDANAARQADKGQPASNALIGYIQEFGSPAKNIPPRPFLVPGVNSIRDSAAKRLGVAAEKALSGRTEAVGQQLDAVGLLGQAAVRGKITDGPFAPLAERTLEARRRRGRTGDKPLIDSGQLRASINFVVRRKGS